LVFGIIQEQQKAIKQAVEVRSIKEPVSRQVIPQSKSTNAKSDKWLKMDLSPQGFNLLSNPNSTNNFNKVMRMLLVLQAI